METVLQRKARQVEAVAASTRALRTTDPATSGLLDRLTKIRSDMARALHTSQSGGAGVDSGELARLRREEDEVEREIAEKAPGTSQGVPILTLTQVQRAIPSGAALVEFATYTPFDPGPPRSWRAPRYVAYVLFRTGDPSWADLGEVSAIDTLCLQLQSSIRNTANHARTLALARDLGRIIFRPIRKYLDSATQVFLSPDGQLNLVPFAALVDDDGRFLVERFEFTYLSSGRDLLPPTARRAPRTGVEVIANPEFGTPRPAARTVYAPLPATAREVNILKSLRPGTDIHEGKAATKSALFGVKGPQILHIATHGFFVPDLPQMPATRVANGALASVNPIDSPMLRSGLVFAGANQIEDEAIATAAEIANLDLDGTELVVLSACETGLGNATFGNAVEGLRRAVTVAGARSQLVSLWRIHDNKTADFIAAYYELLLKGNVGRSAALRKIQLDMIRDRDSGPEAWAAFILIGDGGPLDESRF